MVRYMGWIIGSNDNREDKITLLEMVGSIMLVISGVLIVVSSIWVR